MSNILTIATLEMKRMRRNHMVWFVVLISIFLLFLMDWFNYFTLDEQLKMIQDFALGMTNLVLLFLAVYYPASLLKEELAHKTIYNLLSKPVTRAEVILGKALSVALLSLFALICNGIALWIMLTLKGGVFHSQLLMALVLIYMKHGLLIAFSMLFAVTPLSTILCSILTFMVYCLGTTKSYFIEFSLNTTREASSHAHHGHDHGRAFVDPYTQSFTEFVHSYFEIFRHAAESLMHGHMAPLSQVSQVILFAFIPNLRLFDLVEKITLGQAVPLTHLLFCGIHFVGVSLILFTLTIILFKRKEL